MNDKYIILPILLFIFLCLMCGLGLYSDHVYKMKKLELMEKGILKE